MENVHLVTRYNEYTNDLDIVAVCTSGGKAHNRILQDIQGAGLAAFRKQRGANASYQLTVKEHYVNLDNVVTYTITEIPVDKLVDLKKF